MATGVPEFPEGSQRSRVAAERVSPLSRRAPRRASRLAVLVTLVITVAVLYVAREVLIPLALAILLSFVLAPWVNRLAKLGLGRVFSVMVASTLTVLVIAVLGWVMFTQTMALTGNLPRYRDNIRQKISSVQSQSSGTVGRTIRTLKQIGEEMLQADSAPPGALEPGALPLPPSSSAGPSTAPVTKPVPVELVRKPSDALDSITGTFTPLASPLVNTGIVFVFAIFFLLHREDLRDRLIALIGPGQLTATMRAMDEGASRVSRYLLMLLIVNGTYGLGVGVGLFLIGVPNAILFGVLAALLRFIPYVGSWLGAALPIILSLAEFESWSRPLITIGVFAVLELVSNNIVEPWLYGSRTGVSPTAVVASAVFWGWLWGPIGLILSTPLTVCLVVLGRYVPHLEYLSVLLGDRPSLPTEVGLYQRLLATDYDEAFQFTQEYLKDKPLIDLYENVLMPTLAMAEHDRHAGRLEEGQSQFIDQSLRDLIEELGDRQRSALSVKAQAGTDARESAAADGPPVGGAVSAPLEGPARPLQSLRAGTVLCIPARDEADEIPAIMLAQLLEFQGISARVIPTTTLAGEILDEMDKLPPRSVCVCAMPPAATSHARYLCKRILARFSDMKLIVGIWNTPDLDRARERIRTCGTDRVVATFTNAIELLRI